MGKTRGAPRLVADLALLAVAGAWGLTFPFGKVVLASLTPFTYLALRFTLAAFVLAVIMPRRLAAMPRRLWTRGAGVGAVLFLGYVFQTIGLRLTTASNAGFITGLSVVIVPVISALWLRKTPPAWVLVGIALATVGLWLLTLNEAIGVRRGDLLILACAGCFALHIVLVGRFARSFDPVGFATAQVAAVAVLSVLAAAPDRPLPALEASGQTIWILVVFMVLTATVAAFLIQTWAQRFTTASHTGLMFAFEPVAAALAARVVLGELLAGRRALGAGLILAGIVVAELNQEAQESRTEG